MIITPIFPLLYFNRRGTSQHTHHRPKLNVRRREAGEGDQTGSRVSSTRAIRFFFFFFSLGEKRDIRNRIRDGDACYGVRIDEERERERAGDHRQHTPGEHNVASFPPMIRSFMKRCILAKMAPLLLMAPLMRFDLRPLRLQ